MNTKRRKSKIIHLGDVAIGGNNPVSIQSMTKTDTRNVKATVKQIHKLEEVGCEIIRVSVPDSDSAKALKQIVKKIHIPLVADIHFDAHLAVQSILNGASGIRINPGNIGGREKLKEIVKVAKQRKVPIRVGVNSGSLDRKWLNKYNGITPKALAGSVTEYIKLIEGMGFRNMKVSVKVPDVRKTIDTYRLISKEIKYPLHLGVTEAGLVVESAVRSSIAIGTLLMEGIGDTIRVSVTGDPIQEVIIAKEILQNLGLRRFGPILVSCPTCSRCKVDLEAIVKKVKRNLACNSYTKKCGPVASIKKIAIMGCVVNGPGEAKDSDIGIACGRGSAVLFKNGKRKYAVKEKDIVKCLLREISAF